MKQILQKSALWEKAVEGLDTTRYNIIAALYQNSGILNCGKIPWFVIFDITSWESYNIISGETRNEEDQRNGQWNQHLDEVGSMEIFKADWMGTKKMVMVFLIYLLYDLYVDVYIRTFLLLCMYATFSYENYELVPST